MSFGGGRLSMWRFEDIYHSSNITAPKRRKYKYRYGEKASLNIQGAEANRVDYALKQIGFDFSLKQIGSMMGSPASIPLFLDTIIGK